ncbi:MAG: 2,5-diamino-6-ribosylamino-4(3H)-pyrimidinone 5'-phosphate reductase [Verrucomicrobia subdivision 3 bacterium]|nr:2,5-diamino-6-ribosylamino-4(3H)-pyrimidinone 5'-phosphate reductase [Limisphaerales bacterium]MCS1412374.1 2,5-diamino-6-ribosylamino-4(3H)-pyrimidinone 5'-phosphate reductase [Limisphaerales bacterium]
MPEDSPKANPRGRPYILLNMAMSADGKIAAARSYFSRFGSRADQSNLYRLRHSVDGVLCAATTINRDNAVLDLRTSKHRSPNPPTKRFHRIIVTGRGTIPLDKPVFKETKLPLLILTTTSAPKRVRDRYETIVAGVHVSKGREIDWAAALAWLRKIHRIQRLLLEGGGTLNQSLFRRDLIDEINLTICPLIIGGDQSPTIAEGEAFDSLDDCTQWQHTKRKRRGNELYITLQRKRNHRSSQAQK